jgi:ubiquinone/menaquinone biosynthesis C-methylase UbiE
MSSISAGIKDRDKEETIKQWNNDPCGGSAGKGLPVGSQAFYERIDENRYEQYAPWMKSVMEYDHFKGQRLLEVGFGMGTDLFQFASHGAIVSGIDLTPKHCEIASQRFKLYGIPADLRLGDAEDMPYEDESFDAVYTFGVIHHSPNTEKIVDEIYRVLKPGGRAIIGVYHKLSFFYLAATVLWNYILKLRFLRESLRRTMSRIEYRESSDACPLVKVYGRREMNRMLKAFSSVQFEIRQLTHDDFGRFKRFVPRWLPAKLEPIIGWYLVAKCVK